MTAKIKIAILLNNNDNSDSMLSFLRMKRCVSNIESICVIHCTLEDKTLNVLMLNNDTDLKKKQDEEFIREYCDKMSLVVGLTPVIHMCFTNELNDIEDLRIASLVLCTQQTPLDVCRAVYNTCPVMILPDCLTDHQVSCLM